MSHHRSGPRRAAPTRSGRARSRFAVGVALIVTALAVVPGLTAPAHAAGTAYFVSPTGVDTNSGTSAAAPFRTIQHALDLAQPGTTITLAPGEYKEAALTKVAGTAGAPITVKGPETGKDPSGRYRAVLYSKGGRAFTINHSFYTLDGFTIDGQPNIPLSEYPTSLAQVRAFKDNLQTQGRAINSKLVYVAASDTVSDLTGITISNMFLNGSGGECVRFRNRTSNSLVVGSVIQNCGIYGAGDDTTKYKYHNGEGVYIGTSPKSTTEPFAANDTSNGIAIRDTTVHTFGAECLEVKENAHDNRLEGSDCGFNDEPLTWKGSNIELRGDHNVVLGTKVGQSRGWNVKLASDAPSYDLGGNSLQKNGFSGPAAAAVRNDESTVGSSFCANTFASTPVSEGSAAMGDPTAACPDTTAPTAPTNLAAKATSPTSVDLSWTAATDDVGVKVYNVLRGGALVGTSTSTSFSDTTLVASTAYTYTVVALDAAGNASPASAGASVTTPPPAPTALTATATSPTAVSLAWTAPPNVPVASYGVLRNGAEIARPTTTSFADSGLTASTAYTYAVVARDAAGNTSPASAPASVTTPAPPVPTTTTPPPTTAPPTTAPPTTAPPTTPPPTAKVITVEAESGTLTAPMASRADAAAQGGRYVSQTTGTTVGKDTMTVNVPVAGRYALALRVIAPNASSDSFTYAVDTGAGAAFNLGTRTSWTWVTGPTLTLTAGSHKIIVSKRENGARLDAVRLTPVP